VRPVKDPGGFLRDAIREGEDRTDPDWGVDRVEDPLIAAIENANAGEFDGNEIALDGTEVVLYAHGPDTDALWRVMEPIVRAVPPGPTSYVIKRYGRAGDPGVREVRVDL
jgi:hypothetical protein